MKRLKQGKTKWLLYRNREQQKDYCIEAWDNEMVRIETRGIEGVTVGEQEQEKGTVWKQKMTKGYCRQASIGKGLLYWNRIRFFFFRFIAWSSGSKQRGSCWDSLNWSIWCSSNSRSDRLYRRKGSSKVNTEKDFTKKKL